MGRWKFTLLFCLLYILQFSIIKNFLNDLCRANYSDTMSKLGLHIWKHVCVVFYPQQCHFDEFGLLPQARLPPSPGALPEGRCAEPGSQQSLVLGLLFTSYASPDCKGRLGSSDQGVGFGVTWVRFEF